MIYAVASRAPWWGPCLRGAAAAMRWIGIPVDQSRVDLFIAIRARRVLIEIESDRDAQSVDPRLMGLSERDTV
jgi:hypothetical protein